MIFSCLLILVGIALVQVFPKSLNTSIYAMTHVNVVNERLLQASGVNGIHAKE